MSLDFSFFVSFSKGRGLKRQVITVSLILVKGISPDRMIIDLQDSARHPILAYRVEFSELMVVRMKQQQGSILIIFLVVRILLD